MTAAAVRPYFTAGVALAGASLIAVTPVAAPVTPLPKLAAAHLDVQLTAGEDSILNVPINFINDLLNIPYNLFEREYSIDGLVPNFTDGYEDYYNDTPASADADLGAIYGLYDNVTDQNFPDADEGIFHGAIDNLAGALFYTQSWWQSTPTNVWGWDTGNPWNFSALLNVLALQPLSGNLAENLNNYMEIELPIASSDNRFIFQDVIDEFFGGKFFGVPNSEVFAPGGYDYPADASTNPVGTGADPIGVGGDPYQEIWSGQTVHVDPSFGFSDYWDHLMGDPSDNPVHLLDADGLANIIPSLSNLYQSMNVDFNPFFGLDTYLLQGLPWLYGVPALFEGIANKLLGTDLDWLMPYPDGTPLFELPQQAGAAGADLPDVDFGTELADFMSSMGLM